MRKLAISPVIARTVVLVEVARGLAVAAQAVLETSPVTRVVKLDTSPEIAPRRPSLTSAMLVAKRAIAPKSVKKEAVTFATTATRKAISPGIALKPRSTPATIVERKAICNVTALTVPGTKPHLALVTGVVSEATLHVIALLLMTSATVVARVAILPRIALSRLPMKMINATTVVRQATMHVIAPKTEKMRKRLMSKRSKQTKWLQLKYKNEVLQESLL